MCKVTVAELIEMLQGFNQSLIVHTYADDPEEGGDWFPVRPVDVQFNPVSRRVEIL